MCPCRHLEAGVLRGRKKSQTYISLPGGLLYYEFEDTTGLIVQSKTYVIWLGEQIK